MYLSKTPWFLKKAFPSCIWNMPRDKKVMYLTFDDGPHPQATPFVLDQLKAFNAKATFFCIGNNVAAYPKIYERIIEEGNSVGNHTHNHVNGWKVANELYFDDIKTAAKYIDSNLFRPPYGRISPFQLNAITHADNPYRVIMWDTLSGDFDVTITPEKSTINVINNAENGSIIVFHDSQKAFDRMRVALPRTLEHFANKGFDFVVI